MLKEWLQKEIGIIKRKVENLKVATKNTRNNKI